MYNISVEIFYFFEEIFIIGGRHMAAMRLGEWVKGKMVGCGSFGTVHLAMNKSTGGIFVVKLAHPGSGAGREALENEVKILDTLNNPSSSSSSSPYIVQCLGTEEDHQGNLNVFMEYMAGGSLADVAQKFGGALDEEVVRVYTREILRGLSHLHRHGIVHCDLKCKNVLLGSSGNIKLADFGCAKRVKDLKQWQWQWQWHCTGGTPLWMAPEVLRDGTLGFAADIWSLGCTVIEMATGRPPWADEVVSNPVVAMLRISHGDGVPQFPSHFSKEGLDFLARCLEREPNKRCTTGELLSHPFVSTSTRPSRKDYASSPASVLEVQVFEDAYDSDDESDQRPEGNDFSFVCHDILQGTTIWQPEDNNNALGSSGNWITIR